MNKRIGTLRDSVCQCRKSRVLDVRRRILADEERHETVTEFGLTRTFRTEDIQHREELGLRHDDVAKECR